MDTPNVETPRMNLLDSLSVSKSVEDERRKPFGLALMRHPLPTLSGVIENFSGDLPALTWGPKPQRSLYYANGTDLLLPPFWREEARLRYYP